MIREVTLENFKAFGSEQKIPLRRITLVYGANSSGKSTVLNAMLLLKQTSEESINPNIPLLYKGGYTDQQNFSRCVNGRDVTKEFAIGVGMDHINPWWFDEDEVVNELRISDAGGWDHPEGEDRDKITGDLHLPSGGQIRKNNNYCQVNGETILKAIEYFINDAVFCKLKWIGDRVLREDGTNRLFENKKVSVLDDPLTIQYKNRIPDEYLERGYYKSRRHETHLKMEMDCNFDNGKLTDEAYTYHPYVFDLDCISEEVIKALYDFIISKIKNSEVEYEYKDFKKDIIYNLKQTVIFTKNGIPIFYSCLDGGDRNRRGTKKSKLFKLGFEALAENLNFFARNVTENQLCNRPFGSLTYIGPLRKYPERFTDIAKDSYSTVGNDGRHASAILNENPEVLARVNKALKNLGLDYQLKIHSLSGDDMVALGDIYSLQIIDEKGNPLTLCDVGFGISQVLPILIQSVISEHGTVMIEQPEIHLHPKMQTELGDFFIENSKNKQFIIETHSEHLLLRIMKRIKETTAGTIVDDDLKLTPEDISILYVEPTNGQSIVMEMPLNENGELVKAWPGGFFEEGLREMF